MDSDFFSQTKSGLNKKLRKCLQEVGIPVSEYLIERMRTQRGQYVFRVDVGEEQLELRNAPSQAWGT